MSPSLLASWPRPHFQPGGGDAQVLYAVFGRFEALEPLSATKYRSAGPPDGVEISSYGAPEQRDVLDDFRSGWAWDRFVEESPELAGAVADTSRCLVVRGVVTDPSTLDYFRDLIGLIAYLNDGGGLAVYDAQILRWWSPDEWRNDVFARDDLRPSQHVGIFLSDDDHRGRWYHTRGMRKFGRPDLSVTHVPDGVDDRVLDLITRFINLQAQGGHVPEGQEIRIAGLPPGLRCHHAGDADDVEFNNAHIEIVARALMSAGR
ncbi:MAG: hypothetical protein AB7S26_35735 [Sandaracinaceae bacterium]